MLLYMCIDKNHNFRTVVVDAGAATESHFRLVDGERHTVAVRERVAIGPKNWGCRAKQAGSLQFRPQESPALLPGSQHYPRW